MSVTGKSKSVILLLYWLPLIVYCLLIYVQSGLPGPERLPDVRFLDKILHFGAYGLLGALFYRAYCTLPLKNSPNLLILISIASAILYGVSDEIHQYFVPSRNADIMDVVANMIGSICGVYFYHLWRILRKPA
jgi:VanZ family protein